MTGPHKLSPVPSAATIYSEGVARADNLSRLIYDACLRARHGRADRAARLLEIQELGMRLLHVVRMVRDDVLEAEAAEARDLRSREGK